MSEIIRDLPLVSCTVLSYNSAQTIIETLDSIASQTYRNIELIISDDNSLDNSVERCRNWVEHNKNRFTDIQILTVEKNTGVCANGNRALAACHGEWQKGIAADDILLPNCIEDFVDFIKENKDAMWVSSYIRSYNETFDEKNLIGGKQCSFRPLYDMNVEQQLKKLAQRNLINACSLFFNTNVKKEVGGYDSAYGFEDYPLYLKLLENGNKCFFLEKETVAYRIHQSISHSETHLFNYPYEKEVRQFRKEKCFKYLSFRQRLGLKMIWKIEDVMVIWGLNKNSKLISNFYYKLTGFFFNVFVY